MCRAVVHGNILVQFALFKSTDGSFTQAIGIILQYLATTSGEHQSVLRRALVLTLFLKKT